MPKTRINISIDEDLAEYIKLYAQENRTTASEVFTQFVLGLKRRNEGNNMDLIYDNPDFHRTILEVKRRLQDGAAEWHSFEEVFAD